MKTYHVTMSNGLTYNIPSASASNAIQDALERAPGHTVKHCYTDGMSFEIPKHVALPLDYTKPKRAYKQDHTAPMFDEDAIKAESENALYRAGKQKPKRKAA